MQQVNLHDGWQFKRIETDDWLQADVPGSVITDMYRQGIIQNPYWRANEDEIIELGKQSYEFRLTFQVEESMLSYSRVLLVFEGLDTLADITLNGSWLASTDNMHRTYEFDVRSLLRERNNELHIIFRSPVEFITQQQAKKPLWHSAETLKGFPHLRKAHYMFGWDWAPAFPDCGIWKSVSLIGMKMARFDNVYVTQRHSEGQVDLDVQVVLDRTADAAMRVECTLISPDKMEIRNGQSRIDGFCTNGQVSLKINKPELWWPNGFGKQPLYLFDAKLYCAVTGELLDTKSFRIGIRTLTVLREPDEWGESFGFEVNGIPIFAMGATYVPEDSMEENGSRERTERLIKDCIDANFNSIRVRGCTHYPTDWFYDLCDEYGLIVWQELMFDCAAYELTPAFKETVRHELQDNVRRIRHHASLGLWCGNNEIEWAMTDWNINVETKLSQDYLELFEKFIPELLRDIDPHTFYWPSSPSSGGSFLNPNDENRGNGYCWQVWHGPNLYRDYRKFFIRFCTEFGMQSFPKMQTVESFTNQDDRHVFSAVMEQHQKSAQGNNKIVSHLAEEYLHPKDLDSLIYTSQVLQAEAVKYAVEHWRRHRGRCMGTYYFQLNDRWPAVSWSGIDCFGNWKALHYAAKRFFAPVLLSACEEETSVSLHVTNDSPLHVTGSIIWMLRDPLSNVLDEGETEVEIPSCRAIRAISLDFSSQLGSESRRQETYLQYKLVVEGQVISEGSVLFVKPKHFALVSPNITAQLTETSEHFKINLISHSFAKYVELALSEMNAHFEDNFFDMSAGETKEVIVLKSRLPKLITSSEFQQQLRIRSLFDSYSLNDSNNKHNQERWEGIQE